jgi:hypothetical protein
MIRTDHDKNACDISKYAKFSDLPTNLIDHLSYRLGDEFFSSLEWFSCLANSGFSDAPALQLLVVSDKPRNENSAYLVCMREDARRKRLASLSNYYTLQFPFVSGSGRPSGRVINAIVDVIRNEYPAWSEIELGHLVADYSLISALRSAFMSAGYHVDVFHHHWNWHIRVNGRSYAEYFASRPAHLRNTLRRKLRQVTRMHQLRFFVASNLDDLSIGLSDYLHVYERSWKPREVPPQFVSELIRLCARLGILRLGILYLDDAAVAAQFWISSGGVSYIYKLAHDPEYSTFSVGSLLTAHMFEHAIDVDQVSEIDFGVGDEPYKRDWTDMRRQRIGLQAINRRTRRGFLLGLRLTIRDIMRNIGLRSHTPVTLECTDNSHDPASPVFL